MSHWLFGHALADVYQRHFLQEAGVSRPSEGGSPGGPYVRFALSVAKEIGVRKTTGDCYGEESVAKALIAVRKTARATIRRNGKCGSRPAADNPISTGQRFSTSCILIGHNSQGCRVDVSSTRLRISIPLAPLLPERQAADVLGLRVSTLRRWRWAGNGPEFIKIGAAVRYDLAVLQAFIAAGRRTSTSDRGEAAR